MPARRRFAAGSLIITFFLGLLAYNLYRTVDEGVGTFTYYTTVSECWTGLESGQIAAGNGVRINGSVMAGSIRREDAETRVHFTITDGERSFPVTYGSIDLPDLFRDGADVVVEGRFTGERHFDATSVMAKCPTKYETAESASAGEA